MNVGADVDIANQFVEVIQKVEIKDNMNHCLELKEYLVDCKSHAILQL